MISVHSVSRLPAELSSITQEAIGPGTRPSWSTHDLSLALELHRIDKSHRQGCSASHVPRNAMGFRKFFVRLGDRRKLGATVGATSNTPPVSDHRLPIVESGPVELSSYTVDPSAAYENKPGWKSTLHASAGLVIDVVKESSDAFTPLKSVAGGLSAILKHYDVRCSYFAKNLAPLTR